ncbi:hypothetical protein OPT61_g3425 [Boeremia exigua]|uniref:Uncharacterized protein n=1 Tax=Boeremia exigua TaxID=749465 RepID=A0ACC2IHY4_9PLEO|nr:hypothetical protein OPT61_g3425 [Boeremia exigua]
MMNEIGIDLFNCLVATTPQLSCTIKLAVAWPVYPNDDINMHNRSHPLLRPNVLAMPPLTLSLLIICAQIQRHAAPSPGAIALLTACERSRRGKRVLGLEPPAFEPPFDSVYMLASIVVVRDGSWDVGRLGGALGGGEVGDEEEEE